MSADDPSDDELEREAGRDVPLAGGGTRHHAPRLAAEPRAINLAEMRPLLEAEREASDARMGHVPRQVRDGRRPEGVIGTLGWAAREQEERASPLARARRPAQGAPQHPYRQNDPPPSPAPYSPEAQAWDRYLTAALPLVVGLDLEDPEGIAAQMADRLLEERRRRFA